ncbi:hypothetical protein U0070_020019 [Myodes glareolus]|uniref:G-protein coupled receptors family 1 profile domain-containing protein n=1 Tax=Myodes glareolus TaxID=447135 RepID=A0AAW0H136_MYOGA
MVAIVGNGLIITTIPQESQPPHTIYFFLVNLALMDVICTVTVLPKVLQSLVTENTISYGECLIQMFIFSWVLVSELLLFSAMAYDRALNALVLTCLVPTFINDIMTVIADMFLTGLNFLLTMTSYDFIIASILRIRSAEGKKRAFSTCSAT